MYDRRLIQLLLARLERISADSIWAHRASGLRGALFRIETGLDEPAGAADPRTRRLIEQGFEILNRAAQDKS